MSPSFTKNSTLRSNANPATRHPIRRVNQVLVGGRAREFAQPARAPRMPAERFRWTLRIDRNLSIGDSKRFALGRARR
jgi:hypothetical protein